MGGGGDTEPGGVLDIPLLKDLPKKSSDESNGHFRTGTVRTAVAHIITAVIGSGVLSLAWSVAQLGWVVGPLCMVLFAGITMLQSTLLADCYRSPDPEHGHIRNNSYMKAVRRNLGEKSEMICGLFQQLNLFGNGVAYVITSSTAMRAIKKSDCYHKEGHDAPCSFSVSSFMLMFGAVQLVLSQIPDFHDMEWLSILAALMSFCYSIIGIGLGVAKVIGNGRIKGGISGIHMALPSQKVWRVSQALGDIAFAYPYALILLDIQDTLKSPPPENQTMKKASRISIVVTTFFYLGCGCFGYAAFGDDTPGNLLTGFGFYEPYWLIDFANACVVIHLVGGYQIYSQPVFAFADRWFAERFPDSGFVNGSYTVKLPLLPPCRMNPLRLCFRTVYVATTTAVAMAFPYFNSVLGVLGALNFWPLGIYFPVEMYFVQREIGTWTGTWVALEAFSIACLAVSVFALVGSVEGLFGSKLS